MSTQALYRKWRSRNFDQIVGQDHVVRTLRNAVLRGRVGHAYLFCGPRGTGKTSMARILAKAVNCLSEGKDKPCNRCTMCQSIDDGRALDLIEIDAASNRGIDEIRKLREQISFVPTEARYKVYVVDEVHMLTPPAFNALLKTLEEPPTHAIFILATTEPHKVPQTILSRCQRFDFRRIPLQDAIAHLTAIASQEGLRIEPQVLEFIARTSTGSLRDAISLLDQLTAYGEEEITLPQAQIILGTASPQTVAQLVRCLSEGELAEGLKIIRDAIDEGTDIHQLTSQTVEYLRRVMLIQVSPQESSLAVTAEELAEMREVAQRVPRSWLLRTLRRFNDLEFELKASLEPQLALELAFLESALSLEERELALPLENDAETASTLVEAKPAHVQSPTPRRDGAKPIKRARASEPRAQDPIPSDIPSPAKEGWSLLAMVKEKWPLVLQAMRQANRSLEAILRDSEPIDAEGEVVTLGFLWDFHKKKMENPAHKALVEETLSKVLARRCLVRFVLAPKGAEPSPEQNPPIVNDPLVQVAVDQFGAQVVGMKPKKEQPPSQEEVNGLAPSSQNEAPEDERDE